MEGLFRGSVNPANYLIGANDEHGVNPPTPGKRTPYIRYLGRQIYENEFNRAAKGYFIDACLRVGFRVFDVKPVDQDLSLAQRRQAINSARPDLLVTFAFNAYQENFNSVRGLEVFYSATNPQPQNSRRLSENVYYKLIIGTGQHGRGVKTLNTMALSSVTMPATLVEAGFMTNFEDAKLMLDPDYQMLVGEYTCAGICDYLGISFTPRRPQTSRPMLRQGARGDSVRYLQQKLNAKFYHPGTIDGVFGPKTLSAVRAFQRENGLVEDGIVGPLTWAKLIPAGGGARRP